MWRIHCAELSRPVLSPGVLDTTPRANQPSDSIEETNSFWRRDAMASAEAPIVGVIMGSKSDWEHMSAAAEVMEELKVPPEVRILSAHPTPDPTLEYSADPPARGLKVIIPRRGVAAH